MGTIGRAVAVLLGGAMALAGCHEIAQTARKPFAPPASVRSADQAALAQRAQKQNEYIRMGDMPKQSRP